MELGTFKRIRLLFMISMIILILGSLAGFIWGMVSFHKPDRVETTTSSSGVIDTLRNAVNNLGRQDEIKEVRIYNSGSFLGGPPAIQFLVLMLLGVTGLWAAASRHTYTVTVFFCVVLTSFALRILTWILYWSHRDAIPYEHYWFIIPEAYLIVMSLLLIIALKNAPRRTHSVGV